MRLAIYAFFWIFAADGWVFQLDRINEQLAAAQAATTAKNLPLAAQHYQTAFYKYGAVNSFAKLNYAHTLFQLGQYSKSKDLYNQLIAASNPVIRSAAFNQLGLLALSDGEPAVYWFKQALVADQFNITARKNYQLALHLQPEEPDTDPIPPPLPSPPPPSAPDSSALNDSLTGPQNNEKLAGDKEGTEVNTEETIKVIAPPSISPQQASQLLDAMRHNQQYYLPSAPTTTPYTGPKK